MSTPNDYRLANGREDPVALNRVLLEAWHTHHALTLSELLVETLDVLRAMQGDEGLPYQSDTRLLWDLGRGALGPPLEWMARNPPPNSRRYTRGTAARLWHEQQIDTNEDPMTARPVTPAELRTRRCPSVVVDAINTILRERWPADGRAVRVCFSEICVDTGVSYSADLSRAVVSAFEEAGWLVTMVDAASGAEGAWYFQAPEDS